jgi:hypothetical protein
MDKSKLLVYISFMRKLNSELLNAYVVIKGNLGREILAVESKMSFVKIDRLLKGTRKATELEMDSLCRATGYPLDELFPVVENKKESA